MTDYDIKLETAKLVGPHKLLYLTYFGSQLYGTNTENSDTDVKGIFLPSKNSLLLGQRCDHLSFNTKEGNGRNTSEDIDIQLWSLHHWINLLAKGDTNAIDLLYSITYEQRLLFYNTTFLLGFLNHPEKLFNQKKMTGYFGYIVNQSKKYGIKGSRVGVLKKAKEWLDSCHPKVFLPDQRLSFWKSQILEHAGDSSLFFEKEINGVDALVLCGKVHMTSIRMEEFKKRVDLEWNRYGERAALAALNEGIDWKAISHAFRAGYQMLEILQTGGLQYPLKMADQPLDIKQGKIPWELCECNLMSTIDEIQKAQEKIVNSPIDHDYINRLILGFYGEK